MKISLTAYNEFLTYHGKAMREAEGYKHQRFGQAWYNYFSLQKHTPVDDRERVLLNRIYNETFTPKAMMAIRNNFVDMDN